MDSRYASLILMLHPNRGRPRTLFVRRWLLGLGALAIAVGIPALVWGAFKLGEARGEKAVAALEQRIVELEVQGERLRSARQDLKERVRRLQERIGDLKSVNSVRSGEVRKYRQLTDDLQNRIGNLQDELAFYRNILDPEKAERDVSLKDPRVVAVDGAKGEFLFAYKLFQGVANKDSVRGYARVAVTYFDGSGQRQVQYFPDGARVRKNGQKVDFRYFQTVRGRIDLPADAEPARLFVQVYSREGLGELLNTGHDWESLVQGPGEGEGDAA